MTSLSMPNKKLKATGNVHNAWIVSFDLPAGKTCPFAGACRLGCYANGGHYLTEAKIRMNESNYIGTMCDSFVEDIEILLKAQAVMHPNKKIMCRVHTSGDFYSKKYMSKWIQIATDLSDVQFYAYTKSVRWYHELQKEFPSNFCITLSYGGLQDLEILPTDKVSKVFRTREEIVEAGYEVMASDDDLTMLKYDKMGLVYHGNYNRKWELTGWGQSP